MLLIDGDSSPYQCQTKLTANTNEQERSKMCMNRKKSKRMSDGFNESLEATNIVLMHHHGPVKQLFRAIASYWCICVN